MKLDRCFGSKNKLENGEHSKEERFKTLIHKLLALS